MPKVVIIDKSSLEILHTYEEKWETDYKKFTDLYGDENSTIHLQVPENIIYEYIQVVRDTETDEIKIKENETKKRHDGLQNLIKKRDLLLFSTDYTQLPDCPITTEIKNEFKLYRQLLRDIDFSSIDTENFQFPEKPNYKLNSIFNININD